MFNVDHDIVTQRLARIRHLRRPNGEAVCDFERALASHPALRGSGLAALDLARSFDYAHPGQATDAYLAHPVRVATLYLQLASAPVVNGLVAAVVHNILEVGKVDHGNLEHKIGAEVFGVLRVLTVDRARQWDPEYKAGYYAAIGRAPSYAGAIKCLDKLDNLYTLCLNPDPDVRARYLDEITRWVLPLAEASVPAAARRIAQLVRDNQLLGHRPLDSWQNLNGS